MARVTKNRRRGGGRGPSSIGPRCVVAVVRSEAEANREIERTFKENALENPGVAIPRSRIRIGDVPMSNLQVRHSSEAFQGEGSERPKSDFGYLSIAFAYHGGKLYVAEAVRCLDTTQAYYFFGQFVSPELRRRGVYSRRPEELVRDFRFVAVPYHGSRHRVFALAETAVL